MAWEMLLAALQRDAFVPGVGMDGPVPQDAASWIDRHRTR
jgi:hypothetical protein